MPMPPAPRPHTIATLAATTLALTTPAQTPPNESFIVALSGIVPMAMTQTGDSTWVVVGYSIANDGPMKITVTRNPDGTITQVPELLPTHPGGGW